MTYFTSWTSLSLSSHSLVKQMVGRQLTTSSHTKPHKWTFEMLLERRFKQHDDNSPSVSMTKALHMCQAFICLYMGAVGADGWNHHYCNQIQSFLAKTACFISCWTGAMANTPRGCHHQNYKSDTSLTPKQAWCTDHQSRRVTDV